MRVILNTVMAHPRLGCGEPGTVLDLSEDDARPLLESGQADPVTRQIAPAATLFDSAMLDERGRETSMLPRARGRK